MANAEALFFVHHQQAEIGELHVFGKQAVRADQDVDLARLNFLQNFFLLFGRAESADHLDRDWECGEALLESLIMLKDQNRGGREHCHLLVVADGFECRAHGDFCLAVADIPAKQAVHRLLCFHVALDVDNREFLVFGLAVFECVFKLANPFVIG